MRHALRSMKQALLSPNTNTRKRTHASRQTVYNNLCTCVRPHVVMTKDFDVTLSRARRGYHTREVRPAAQRREREKERESDIVIDLISPQRARGERDRGNRDHSDMSYDEALRRTITSDETGHRERHDLIPTLQCTFSVHSTVYTLELHICHTVTHTARALCVVRRPSRLAERTLLS